PLIAGRTQGLNLALDGNVASASQYVLAVIASTNRILQVSVANPSVQLTHRRFWIFVGSDEGVICIPQQSNMRGICPLQDLVQVSRRSEIIMRFNKDSHFSRTCVFT